MRRVLLALFLLFFAARAFAQSAAEVETSIQKQFPGLKVEAVNKTEIEGLYEVLLQDSIVYYHPKSGMTLLGELFSKDGVSLTALRKAERSAAKIKDLPLEKAIKIGNGQHTVIEVVDPDCPFCRKTAAFFQKRSDVTQYVYLFPIKELHPDAERKAQYILCAEDRKKAYEEVLSGKLDDQDFTLCKSPEVQDLLAEHQRIGQRLGVRGTPTLWVDGEFVPGADLPRIVKLLEGKS